MITSSRCFDCLDPETKNALKAWFLAKALVAAGGSDLTNVNTRNSNSTIVGLKALADFRLDSIEVAIYQKLAAALGASVDLPISQLRSMVKCSTCGDPKANRAAIVYLLCQLSLLGK